MIGYLQGKILDHSEGRLLIGVGGPEGSIGYSVLVPHGPSYSLLVEAQPIELFIHTHVREDALDLFGFATRAEKELFLTLLSVNGIGPKGALSILSGAQADELIRAITEGDRAYLTRIPGIGKKIAERVVLELADPMRKKLQAGMFHSKSSGAAGGGPPSGASASPSLPRASAYLDALEALTGLGFREQETAQLLKRLMSDQGGGSAEGLIKSALKELK